MKARARSRIAVLVGAGLLTLAAAGCGGSSTKATTTTKARKARAVQALPGPARLLSAGPPQANGTIWVLSGGKAVRTLNKINLSTRKQQAAVGVNASATAVTQSSLGTVALGLGTAKTGAVQFRNGATGAPLRAVVATSAPVKALAFDQNGTTLYVLNGTGSVDSIAVISVRAHRVTRTIPVSSDTVSIAAGPARAIWAVNSEGVVEEISTRTRMPTESFPVGSSAVALAVSPAGNRLYVLKGTRKVANIAVVNLNLDAVVRALPAASASVGLTISLDGGQLYDLVGTRGRGNIQLIKL